MQALKRIVRPSLFLVLAASCCLAKGSMPQDEAKSCRDFVQAFYAWYVPRALKERAGPASELALRYKPSAFSPELLRALKEDSDAQAKAAGEIVGIDFDPFLNTQDPDPRYDVGKVMQKGATYWVEVSSASSGKKSATPDVVPELIFRDGKWLFVNFHYGSTGRSQDENLLSILKELRAEREKHSH